MTYANVIIFYFTYFFIFLPDYILFLFIPVNPDSSQPLSSGHMKYMGAFEPKLLAITGECSSVLQTPKVQTLSSSPSSSPRLFMVARQLIRNTDFFLPPSQCKPQGGGSRWGKNNTTGIGKKLANVHNCTEWFKNNTLAVPFLALPPLSFSGSSHSSWQAAEPSAIWQVLLMTHVPIYIKPLDLVGHCSKKVSAQGQGPGSKSESRQREPSVGNYGHSSGSWDLGLLSPFAVLFRTYTADPQLELTL